MKTWVKELLFVTIILGAIWGFGGFGTIEAIGSLAVLFTFCHLQVSMRLEEKTQMSPREYRLECGIWQTYYLCLKEMMWFLYFVALGAWSALVGVGIFLVYPIWRKWRKNDRK